MTGSNPATVCFIGLGAMGYPMAGHLVRAGHRVTVYNRSPERSQRWAKEHGAHWAASAAQAARGAGVVFSCVGNDDDLREVALGHEGAYGAMEPDAVFVDHTTTSAQAARAMYAAARERGVHFIDAPVSGGQAGAQGGTLTVMCGGDAAPYSRVQPFLAAYARAVHRIGDSGSGQLAKMVNQLCVAGVVQGLAEGVHFGERAGLDMARVLEVIGSGAAQSWQMQHRGGTMIEGRFDFGFAVEWMRKDLGICLGEARRNGASLPLAALIDQFYAEIEAMGGARWDTSSLVQRLRRGPK
jgi:3-hydroxyisobutyrate dehydrogenase-like beta-hydroxyacid dehydrogenase